MGIEIGILTVRDPGYHPNRRLLKAAREAGQRGILIHPYRLWPATLDGKLELTAPNTALRPQVVIPRQGAQVGDASLALIHQFQLLGVPLVNDLKAVVTARNKFLTQQVLIAAGMPCPDTVFINDAAGFSRAVNRLGGYPVVAKPVSARQGEGVLCIGDADDARRRVLSVLDRQRGVLVQRYLPPWQRRDLRALVIGGELVCAAVFTPSAGEFRANFHLGGTIRPTVLSPDLERIAVTAAHVVGCDVAAVDMMEDNAGGPQIVEVNYSPGFKGLEAATGLDLAGRVIRLAVERYHRTGK